jgi:hypothetical protein
MPESLERLTNIPSAINKYDPKSSRAANWDERIRKVRAGHDGAPLVRE